MKSQLEVSQARDLSLDGVVPQKITIPQHCPCKPWSPFSLWMPSSPSSSHNEQDSPHSSICDISGPLSPQTDSTEGQGDPNAMLVVGVMACGRDGTRLAASRSRDDGQTRSEHKNDIISNTATFSDGVLPTFDNTSTRFDPVSSTQSLPTTHTENRAVQVIGVDGSASGKLTAAASRITPFPTTLSTLTTSNSQQNKRILPLSSDLFLASMNAAFASIGQKQTDQSQNSESPKESSEEVSKAPKEMAIEKLVPPKKPRRKRSAQMKAGQTCGRWTQAEHRAFLEGLKECGREWKKVSMRIPTRTSAQIRSHAQKYFSKLQRDHEAAPFPDLSHASTESVGCATASLASTDNRTLTPNVQRNVERILADPAAAQREVENTMEALRERYRQLQLRLQERQERRRARQGSLQERNELHPVPDDYDRRSCRPSSTSMPRKRSFADIVENPLSPNFSSSQVHDDHSSVSSHLSASVASMGHDELIALHVLGGALPRGESNQDLELMEVRASAASDESVSSSATSAENDGDLPMEDTEDQVPKHSKFN